MPFRLLRWLPAFAFAALLSGCASSYRAVQYDELQYTGQHESNGVEFAYQYDAQPGHYGNKARRRGFAIVAVEATNTTDAPVVLDARAFTVLANGQPVVPLAPDVVARNSRQAVWPYLLWSLLSFAVTEGDEIVLFVPIGIPIAAVNMIQSSSGNRRAARAYRDSALIGRRIEPGETAHGLVFLQASTYAPLTFRYEPGGTAPPVTAPAPTD